YAAFASRDVTAMERLWGEGEVMCIHPGWPPLVGREVVLASWRNILTGRDPPNISFRRAQALVQGTTAVVTCMEMIAVNGEIQQALSATNIFVRAGDGREWRMIHHHAGPANIDPKKVAEDEPTPMN